MSKFRDAIMAGIRRRTEEFNSNTFPTPDPAWTPEQLAIFKFLTGESGGLDRVNESDRPEIQKTMMTLAGIEIKTPTSDYAHIPAYTIVVLREAAADYRSGFPLVKSRLSGYWMENGTGSSQDFVVKPRNLKRASEDDIRKIESKFPEDKLPKLVGAIDFSDEAKLREELTKAIQERTHSFATLVEVRYPEGMTDKARKIFELQEWSSEMLAAFAVLLDDPTLTGEIVRPRSKVTFKPYCAVIHHTDTVGSAYACDLVHVQADTGVHDVFFHNPKDENSSDVTGNHADPMTNHYRVATDEEIKSYVDLLPSEQLHLYVGALSPEQLEALL